jgi:endonuclease YncB( thermonuclease family)
VRTRSLIALALFLSLLSIAQAADFTGPVVAVLDGDTIEVLHNTHPERIRPPYPIIGNRKSHIYHRPDCPN